MLNKPAWPYNDNNKFKKNKEVIIGLEIMQMLSIIKIVVSNLI